METVVLPVSAASPDPAAIERAAAILRGGGLVAFPTETVYGLGANALDAAAVARIFAAKGRPARNPVIVHVDGAHAAWELARSRPDSAVRLAERFWPGPLSLVLPRSSRIPDIVTAGGATVALRVPAHPVALALLRAAQVPLAAPSANRSSHVSPTRAEHVLNDLGGRIDMILDGGQTPGGLESTVLDLSTSPARLLRPGLISPEQIEAVIGPIERPRLADAGPLPSPGMLERHYAPRAPLELAADGGALRVAALRRQGLRVGWLALSPQQASADVAVVTRILPDDPVGYAAELYAALHELDAAGVDRIVAALPPGTEAWLAVHDRLRRAAAALE